MTRIAIVGGGISGLAAAYELELARKGGVPIDWHLFEASNRLGGIVETTRYETPEGGYILEGGPDAWVSEKPWARDLAIELGLEPELIYSNDATRKTYILLDGKLQPMPNRMRMMVPEDLATLDASPIFTASAKQAYADELANAVQLKAAALDRPGNQHMDESVASFVLRHFGAEVLANIAAPLLSGVFGGDVHKLSVRAVMAPFVAMERDHGSLILALQTRAKERGSRPPHPIFTSLRRGMGSLLDALVEALPAGRLHLNAPMGEISRSPTGWIVRAHDDESASGLSAFDHLFLATSLDTTRRLITTIDAEAAALLPTSSSSAVLASFCWAAGAANTFNLPPGFGFLVPPDDARPHSAVALSGARSAHSKDPCISAPGEARESNRLSLLAATFTDQKFPHRAPPGARIIRAFFGGPSADQLAAEPDESTATAALTQLRAILGPLPDPDPALTTVRRWPRSLPQYELGHLDRIAQLDGLIARIGDLTLLGNSYRGVGVPDLIQHARAAARRILSSN